MNANLLTVKVYVAVTTLYSQNLYDVPSNAILKHRDLMPNTQWPHAVCILTYVPGKTFCWMEGLWVRLIM